MGVNVLLPLRERARTVFETIKNKWHISNELSSDIALLRAAAAYRDAEAALVNALSEVERGKIVATAWEPAYADLCRLPAMTMHGLAAKVELLLDEHEHGEGPLADDLRRSIRHGLRIINL